MRNDAIDVKVNKGLLAFGTEEEVTVFVVVHEEVFGEDGGAGGVAEEVEVGFLVGVGVGVVRAESVAGEVGLGGGVEGGGEGIGPGAFTPNMIDVWAYGVEKGDSRVFKVMRIHSVEATETPWAFEDKHKVKKPDVFRMTGSPVEKVVLQLNTRAKSLLVEEYPLAERDLKREDGTWLLRPTFRPTFF